MLAVVSEKDCRHAACPDFALNDVSAGKQLVELRDAIGHVALTIGIRIAVKIPTRKSDGEGARSRGRVTLSSDSLCMPGLVAHGRAQFFYDLFCSPAMHATRIVYWHLRKEPDAAKRLDALARAIADTSGFFLPVDFVSTQAQRLAENPAGVTTDNDVNDLAGLEILKKLCLAKLDVAAADGRLARSVEMTSLLSDWLHWAGEEGPQKFCAKLVEAPSGALQLLEGFEQVMTSQSVSDYVSKETRYINLSNLEKFVSADAVESVITSVEPTTLNESEGRALAAFQRAMKGRREGKPDFGSRGMHDDMDE